MPDVEITADIARRICQRNDVPTMLANMSRKQLYDMFVALYEVEPQRYDKVNMAYACWNFVQDELRTADLCKHLH